MNDKRRVVIIDDSPIVRKMAEVALEEAGYEVYSAEDGEEGLKITKEVIPSVILVDFIMPKMSGYQFCQAVKEDEALRNIPIILITAKGEDVGKKFLEKFGVIDYFIKPFKSFDLVEKVNSIIELQKTLSPTEEILEEPQFKGEEVSISPLEPQEISISEGVKEGILSIEPLEVAESEKVPDFKISEPFLGGILSVEGQEILEEKPFEITASADIQDEVVSLGSDEQIESVELYDLSGLEVSKGIEGEAIFVESSEEEEGGPIPFVDLQETKNSEEKVSISSIEDAVERITRRLFKEEFQLIVQRSVTDALKRAGIIKESEVILSGSIGIFPIRDILYLISYSGLTAKLSIFSDKLNADIYFLDSGIIYASTDKSNSFFDFEVIKNPSEEIKNRIRDGIYDTLSEVIQLESGSFSLERVHLLENLQNIPLCLNVSNSLIEASRRVNEKVYMNLFDGGTVFFKLLRDSAIKNFNLDRNEMRVFACINGERTVSEIVDISGLSGVEAYRAFYVLFNGGIVKM
ncbi:MAG: response regulator [Thermodesulfovibrionales bacterium]|nr:response regulator [Thermodesulfovibrionales bacterium]